MNSPYKYRLEKFKGKRGIITIHRADAPNLEGQVAKVEEDGCEIDQEGSSPDSVLRTFVSYEDIRGISSEEWDLDNI
jgi:hypothetical protein